MQAFDSAFKMQTLTKAINLAKYTPGRISEMGIFEAGGINTVDAAIEFAGDHIVIVDAKPRGAPGTPILGSKRKIKSIRVPHLPEAATVRADEVQGVRAFGSNNQMETVQAIVNGRVAQMRRMIDATIEAHRLAAVMGNYYDANGGITSLFTEFGVDQTTHAMLLGSDTTKLREKTLEVIEKIETALDGITYSGITAVCGKTFWKSLIEHKAVKDTYLNSIMAAELRGDPTLGFEFGGIRWERYRGTSAVKVGDSDAYAIPQGVDGLFLTRFAPADYNETVNTIGLPYYAKGEPMKFDKGWDLEAQSNPLNLCTRPNAVAKLTIA